jgi:glutathione S-transferase
MRLFGRSSSHFTRIARIFAIELELALEFVPIRDLMSTDPADYGDNPALKMPTLETIEGQWFGSLGICRELTRNSELNLDIVWPDQLETPLTSNAQEMVLQSMATEVALLMAKASGVPADDAHQAKLSRSLLGSLQWLEDNAGAAIASLPPERDLSYLEVSLFCLVEHLESRAVVPTEPYPGLRAFAGRFALRSSARATPYKFDFPPG